MLSPFHTAFQSEINPPHPPPAWAPNRPTAAICSVPNSTPQASSWPRTLDSSPAPGHGLHALYLSLWMPSPGRQQWVAALGTAQTKRGGRFPAAAGSNCHDNQQADYSITAFLLKSDIKPRDNTSSASRGAWFSKHWAMFNFLIYLVIMFANLTPDLFFFIIINLSPCSLKRGESKMPLKKHFFFLFFIAGKHAG